MRQLRLRLSLVELKLSHTRWLYRRNGLKSREIELDNGAIIHCWLPSTAESVEETAATGRNLQKTKNKQKPALVLLHGFGSNATIAWDRQVSELSKHFRLYLPDLLFFGKSRHQPKEGSSSAAASDQKGEDRRSEVFQARCIHDALRKAGLKGPAFVAGHSYGGFVAYRLAHLYGSDFVEKLVMISSGVMMDERSNDAVLEASGCGSIHEILVPETPAELKRGLVFVTPLPSWLPDFVYADMWRSLRGDSEARKELVDGTIVGKGKEALPKVKQEVLIVWGEDDQIFYVGLAHKLHEFLGSGHCEVATLKGVTGHLPTFTKPRECNRIIISFLTSSRQS